MTNMGKSDGGHARRQAVIDRLMARGGLRASIDAKCADCIFDPQSGKGTWRAQVQACTVTSCPLYKVRPKSRGKKHE